MLSIPINCSTLEGKCVVLDNLRGAHEIAVTGTGMGAAHQLVGGMILERNSPISAAECAALSVSDFDRILIALFGQLYGENLDCESSCQECREPFEFSISIEALFLLQKPERTPPTPLEQGWYEADGVEFRLPTISDLASSHDGQALVAECVRRGQFDSLERAEEAFRTCGSLASDDVELSCPTCEASATTRVDLVSYFTAMLQRERPFLTHEIHALAHGYGWSLREILWMERSLRRDFVKLIGRASSRSKSRARRVV